MNIKRIICYIFLALFSLVFLVSAFMLVRHFADEKKSEQSFEELTVLVPDQPETETQTEPTPADVYGAVYEQNTDLVGWIRIDGTTLDYPVMQTKGRTNYYLRRGFDKKYSYFGVPYAAENCDVNTSSNVVIYGHNMENGTMFAALRNYTSKSFYEQNKYITFDTLEQFGTYEIISVFKTVASYSNDFAYHQFADGDEQHFNDYIENCKRLSLYDIQTTAVYGDRLITLSTCEYTREHGRLVVVAKKIK